MGGHNAARTNRQAIGLSKSPTSIFRQKDVDETMTIGGTSVPAIKIESGEGPVLLIKDGGAFHSAVEEARDADRQADIQAGIADTPSATSHADYVHTYSPQEYEDMKALLVLPKGAGGAAVKKNNDIVSVFRNKSRPIARGKKVTDLVLPVAIQAGGKTLDCYNGGLPALYSRFGFVPVARVKFDINEAPTGWNIERDGEPDIIFMAHDGRSQEQMQKTVQIFNRLLADKKIAASRQEKESVQRKIDKLPYVTYEQAVEAQKDQNLPRSLKKTLALNKKRAEQREEAKKIKPLFLSIPRGGAMFVSPNRTSNQITAAKKRLLTKEQQRFREASKRIDKLLGFPSETADALGAWTDGAENSTLTKYNHISMEEMLVAAAMRGYLGEQKAVLLFKPNKKGSQRIHEMIVHGDAEKISQDLIASQIKDHTIIPLGNGAHRVIVSQDLTQAETSTPMMASNTSETMMGAIQTNQDPLFADWIEQQPDALFHEKTTHQLWHEFDRLEFRIKAFAEAYGSSDITITQGDAIFIGSDQAISEHNTKYFKQWDEPLKNVTAQRKHGRITFEKIIKNYLRAHPEKASKWYALLNSWKFGDNNEPVK